jgi:helicase MOV-10
MSVQSENKPAYKTTAPSDHSKRVAIPRIKFLDSNAPKLTLSSRDSIIHTNEQPMPSTEVPPHTGHQCPPPSSEDVNREYNVYAAPFIPAQLKEINLELGVIVDSITKHKIDYPTYIKKFAGSSFLPERPTYSPKQQPLLYAPSEVSYLDHISTLWQVEIAALTHQNAQHALYKVPLERRRTQDGEELFLVPIPGLREDNPRIELGDTLQLRSLFRDSRGNIVDIFQQCPLSFGMGYKHRYWTGTIWNASVYGVHRATETVYLKANGLQEVQIGSVWFPLVVNVIFPLNREYTKRCQKALVLIDSALSKAKNFGCVEDNIKEAPHIIEDDALNDNVSSIHLTQTMSPSDQLNSATRNDWIRRILFPAEKDGKLQTILRKIPQRGLYDSLLNYEQAHAVTSICDKNYGTLPYLISGPPGTGKTKSLVEVAMQLLETHTADHILICAPSDQAADTLAMRLKYYLNPTQLLRLNGPWRADNEVTRELMGYTYMENEMFYLPPFRKLMAYNVVVTSCRDASVLMDARLTNTDLWSLEHNMLTAFHPEHKKPPLTLHWGALLVDEAAQATELDVLSAISVVCPPAEYPEELPQPCFVMAGDEHQLGPRTASHDTMLSRSLFARLLDRGALYRDHPLSRSNMKPSSSPPVLKSSMLPIIYPPFANLIRNYRSHPAILSVPSSLFYNDTLIPEAPIPNTPLQHSSLWEGCGWPVLFIPNGGSDEIERDGGGWYVILCSETYITIV